MLGNALTVIWLYFHCLKQHSCCDLRCLDKTDFCFHMFVVEEYTTFSCLKVSRHHFASLLSYSIKGLPCSKAFIQLTWVVDSTMTTHIDTCCNTVTPLLAACLDNSSYPSGLILPSQWALHLPLYSTVNETCTNSKCFKLQIIHYTLKMHVVCSIT